MEYLRFEKKGLSEFSPCTAPRLSTRFIALHQEELERFLAVDLPGEGIRVLILTGAGDRAFVAGKLVAAR